MDRTGNLESQLMKKIALVVIALCACLAITSMASAAGQTGSAAAVAKTKVKLKFSKGTPPYSESAFTGKVKSKAKVCRKKRKVKIKNVGKAKTNKKGKFTIAASSSLPPGKYVAKVKKKTVKKAGTVTTCLKGKKKIKIS